MCWVKYWSFPQISVYPKEGYLWKPKLNLESSLYINLYYHSDHAKNIQFELGTIRCAKEQGNNLMKDELTISQDNKQDLI